MLRSWLPQHHHLQHLQYNRACLPPFLFWPPRAAASSIIFLQELYCQASSLDRRGRPSSWAVVEATSSSEGSISTLEKKSKNQKKREALRGVDWAIEFSSFSDSQLRRAIRWGNLQEEVFDAVRLVKRIGRDGKHARRRQLNLIGGMLRTVDPELMEAVIKAIKDGDVDGLFNKSSDSGDADDPVQQENLSSEEDSSDEDHVKNTVERWLQGLLSGDSDVLAEVYSIRSADFNRQELRKLIRDASESPNSSPRNGSEEDSQEGVDGAPISVSQFDRRVKLREYLQALVAKVSDDD